MSLDWLAEAISEIEAKIHRLLTEKNEYLQENTRKVRAAQEHLAILKGTLAIKERDQFERAAAAINAGTVEEDASRSATLHPAIVHILKSTFGQSGDNIHDLASAANQKRKQNGGYRPRKPRMDEENWDAIPTPATNFDNDGRLIYSPSPAYPIRLVRSGDDEDVRQFWRIVDDLKPFEELDTLSDSARVRHLTSKPRRSISEKFPHLFCQPAKPDSAADDAPKYFLTTAPVGV